MCSWSEFGKIEKKIKASHIGFNNKTWLLVELNKGGRQAVPKVAALFKEIKKKG